MTTDHEAQIMKINIQLSMDMLMLRNLIKLSADFLEAMQEGGTHGDSDNK